MPSVSIIVPNYNHRSYLEERLASIFGQNFDDYDIIILDDASTDGSASILTRYTAHPKVSAVIVNEENSGSPFRQWQRGVEMARGRYIWIAESDDRADPTLLGTLHAALEADPARVLAFCQSRRIDGEGAVVGDWRGWTQKLAPGLFERDFEMAGEAFAARLLLHRNVVPNASAALFRRDAYLACGGADPTIRYCGDWFVWLKLVLQGRVCFRAAMLNDFRQHAESVIASRRQAQGEVFRKKYDLLMRQALDAHLAARPAAAALRRQNLALLRREAAHEALLLQRHGLTAQARNFARLSLAGEGVLRGWWRRGQFARAGLGLAP